MAKFDAVIIQIKMQYFICKDESKDVVEITVKAREDSILMISG